MSAEAFFDMRLARARAVGILAARESYDPQTHDRVVSQDSTAYRTALAYGSGGLEAYGELATAFLDERGILVVTSPQDSSYRALALKGGEIVLDRVMTPAEIRAPVGS